MRHPCENNGKHVETRRFSKTLRDINNKQRIHSKKIFRKVSTYRYRLQKKINFSFSRFLVTSTNCASRLEEKPDKPEMRAPQNSFVSIHNMYQQTSARYDRRKASNFLRMSTVTISTKRQREEEKKTKSEFTDEPKHRRKKSLPG